VRSLLLLSILLPACRDKADGADGASADDCVLVFTMEDSIARAGEDIRFKAYLDGGLEPIPVDVVPASDIEDVHFVDDDAFMVTVAAEHTISAEVEYSGVLYTAEVPLEVSPGLPVDFDFQLDDVSTQAGQPLGYTLTAWDEYFNVIQAEVPLDLSSTDVKEVEGSLVSTVPSLYTATASFDDYSDVEQFVVVPGPPAGIDLRLSSEDVELDETVVADIAIVDAYGNEVDDDWDLWVEPYEDVAINYNAVTFGSEGRFTVWASTSDGSFTDSVGPLLIDSTGPELGIWTPERGLQTNLGGQDVTGTATEEFTGVESITVNGEPAEIDEDDNWEAWVDYDFGTNWVHTIGVDGDGNETSDLRSVISGSFNYYGATVPDGLQIRINEAGFDSLEGLVGELLALDDLLSSVPNPLISEVEQTCWDILGWEECFDWYSIDLWINQLDVGELSMNLDPTGAGYIDATASVSSFYLEIEAEGVIAEIPYGLSGELSADRIDIGMHLYPYVSGATLAMTVSDVWVDLVNFDLDQGFYDVIEDVLDFFGLDLNEYLANFIEGLVSDAILDEVPAILQEALQGLEIVVPLELMENTYTLEALFSEAVVDDAGMTVGLDTYFTADAWLGSGDPSPGSLFWPYTPPSYDGSGAPMELALSSNFMNQLFHALWGGGLLEMEIDGSELGLDLSEFSDFLPSELTALSIGVKALQPPVVLPGTSGALLDLQVGDLELSLYNGSVHEKNLWMRVYVNVQTALELSATEDSMLEAGLGDLDISFDLVYPNDRTAYAADAELLMETLVPLLMPTLTDALGVIPLPELEGFSLTDFDIGQAGAENGYVSIGGNLAVAGE
jgi:hypothetical protein